MLSPQGKSISAICVSLSFIITLLGYIPISVTALSLKSSLFAMHCLHGRSALNPSLKPPKAWLPRLSAGAVTMLPKNFFSPSQVLKDTPYKISKYHQGLDNLHVLHMHQELTVGSCPQYNIVQGKTMPWLKPCIYLFKLCNIICDTLQHSIHSVLL